MFHINNILYLTEWIGMPGNLMVVSINHTLYLIKSHWYHLSHCPTSELHTTLGGRTGEKWYHRNIKVYGS